AILGHEFGIGVRNGCFCAHPLILHLLEVDDEQSIKTRDQIISGDKSEMPGLIRASFGLYNTLEEVDSLIDALEAIAAGEYSGEYIQDPASGEYTPVGWEPGFENFFSLN
ncbi:MAG: aminotransferase class V-fold PLP-dependent enzyme, partial [Chloroflexota bacterium]